MNFISENPVLVASIFSVLTTALLGVIAYHVRRVDQGIERRFGRIDFKFDKLFELVGAVDNKVDRTNEKVDRVVGAHETAERLHACPMEGLTVKLEACPLLEGVGVHRREGDRVPHLHERKPRRELGESSAT